MNAVVLSPWLFHEGSSNLLLNGSQNGTLWEKACQILATPPPKTFIRALCIQMPNSLGDNSWSRACLR